MMCTRSWFWVVFRGDALFIDFAFFCCGKNARLQPRYFPMALNYAIECLKAGVTPILVMGSVMGLFLLHTGFFLVRKNLGWGIFRKLFAMLLEGMCYSHYEN